MWLGEALWLTLAVYGLATLAEALHGAFQVVKYLGVAYLLYLAWKIWFAPVAVASDGRAPRPGHSRIAAESISTSPSSSTSEGMRAR